MAEAPGMVEFAPGIEAEHIRMTTAIQLPLNESDWAPINDGVMGGVSVGAMVKGQKPDQLVFKGELSLENNGGFASVRRVMDEDLSGIAMVRLRVKGDGRTYQLRLRQDGRFDGIAWRRTFTTAGDWQTIILPLSEFKPVFRGRPVAEAGELRPENIQQLSLMLADKKPGPFLLRVGAIEFLPHLTETP
jgi:monofunctional biosynthetic peptidoglycan transglycosylase